MTTTAMTVLGFCIIFIATTAGAALVFLFKGELSGKLNTLFLGFASGGHGGGVRVVAAHSVH